MKRAAFFILTMTMAVSVFAQSAKEENIKFNKMTVPGFSYETTEFDDKTTADALKARMEKDAKLKGFNMKGFRLYQSQPFAVLGALNYDIYTKVAAVGNKKNRKTVIYLLVSKGNENFEAAAKDQELATNVKTFLNDFAAVYLRQYDTEQKYQAYTKLLAKLEKEHKSLNSDKANLNKQLEKKEKEIIDKEAEITKVKGLLNSLNR